MGSQRANCLVLIIYLCSMVVVATLAANHLIILLLNNYDNLFIFGLFRDLALNVIDLTIVITQYWYNIGTKKFVSPKVSLSSNVASDLAKALACTVLDVASFTQLSTAIFNIFCTYTLI